MNNKILLTENEIITINIDKMGNIKNSRFKTLICKICDKCDFECISIGRFRCKKCGYEFSR